MDLMDQPVERLKSQNELSEGFGPGKFKNNDKVTKAFIL